MKDHDASQNQSTVAKQLFKSSDLMTYMMEFLEEKDQMFHCLVNKTCVYAWLRMPSEKILTSFDKYRILAFKAMLRTNNTNTFAKFADCIIGPEPYRLTKKLEDDYEPMKFLCFRKKDDNTYDFDHDYMNVVYALFNHNITEKHWNYVIGILSDYNSISCASEYLVLAHARDYCKSRNFECKIISEELELLTGSCRCKERSKCPKRISIDGHNNGKPWNMHYRYELRAMIRNYCSDSE